MKTAEEMMIEFIESEIKADGKIKMSAKKFYKIYNWYQEVEFGWNHANSVFTQDDNGDLWFGDDMSYNKRVDANHAEIRDGLRDLGFDVFDSSMFGKGFPDLIVRGKGRVILLEIKDGNAKLTDAESKFHDMFSGLGVYIVRTLYEAIEFMNRERI